MKQLHQLHPCASCKFESSESLDAVDAVYIVDSCPVASCANIRIPRSRLYTDEKYRGYCASRKQYFFGVKVHLVVNAQGIPMEVLLTPGSCADIKGVKQLPLELPSPSTLYADKGYNDYGFEETLRADKQITFLPLRKKNSKRLHSEEVTMTCRHVRKRVETTFSQIKAHFASHIHAVTSAGFELKILLTVLAQAILGWQLGLFMPA